MTARPLFFAKTLAKPAYFVAALALSACFGAPGALAQTIPGSATSGQIQKQFDQPIRAPETPDLKLPDPQDKELSEAEIAKLKKKTFTLKKVTFKGVSVFPESKLASTYEGLVGTKISLLDATLLARKISALYRNNGYVLSKALVPPQDVTDGSLEIRVIEGYIGSYEIAGKVRNDKEQALLDSYAKAMRDVKPTRVQDLEKYLLLINDLPGVRVSGLLRPLADGSVGAAELVLNLHTEDFEGYYSLDNRGNRYVGPWQHLLNLTANSTFGYFDRTQVRFFFADPQDNELLGGDITYELPLGTEGTLLALKLAHTHSQPGSDLDYLDIVGTTNEVELKVSRPFIRQRKENMIGRFSFDYKDTTTNVYNDTVFTKDKLRVLRAGLLYNIIDDYHGNNLVDAEISQGLSILDATGSGAMRSNSVGESGFTKITASVSRVQALPNDFSVLLAGTGQYAFTPLFVDEQFGVGGAEFGRAFAASSSLGDHGLAGKVEFRYTDYPGMRYLSRYQLFTFFDIGRTWVRKAAAGANDKRTRSSAGFGSRMNFTENLTADLELDFPMIEPEDEQTEYRGNPRWFLKVTARF